jgi:type 2 lantibiotic biosynthesis protein LanM
MDEIVFRSSPLWARSPGELSADGSLTESVADVRRLTRLAEIHGGAAGLNSRLSAAGESLGSVAQRMSSQSYERAANAEQLPGWALTLQAVIEITKAASFLDISASEDRVYPQGAPVPFQELLIGFVIVARRELTKEKWQRFELFDDAAILDQERALLKRLSFLASRSIGHDFYLYRIKHAPALALELPLEGFASTAVYRSFLVEQCSRGMYRFWSEYPVLARLCSVTTQQFVERTKTLYDRVLADYKDFARLGVPVIESRGAIVGVESDVSDLHHGGQSVVIFRLATGAKIVYKPRSVRPEIAFNDLIAWYNKQSPPLSLRVVMHLDKGSYGWAEFVSHKICEEEGEFQRFYLRAGTLLALLYVCSATDIHCQNLIASGEHPVAIDLEGMLSAVSIKNLFTRAGLDGQPNFPGVDHTVLDTSMLPAIHENALPDREDSSGLGEPKRMADLSGIGFVRWLDINTDKMRLNQAAPKASAESNSPFASGSTRSPSEFLRFIKSGYQQGYQVILKKKSELFSNNDLLRSFDTLELRVIVRNTESYAQLQNHLLYPEFLKDGIDRSIELDWLARPLLSGREPYIPGRLQVLREELEQIERLDIPHFGTHMWQQLERSTTPDDFLFEGTFDSRVLVHRLSEMTEQDCERQMQLIESSFMYRFAES